ncbi:positive regulation of transcription from RNA polymerase II promoter by glucose, partial [Dermatophagoides farinae]
MCVMFKVESQQQCGSAKTRKQLAGQKPIRQEIVNLNGSLGSRSFCCKMNHSLLVNIRASMLRLFTNKPVPLSKPLCGSILRLNMIIDPMFNPSILALLIKYTQIIDPRHSMDNDNLGWVYILDYNQFETLINGYFIHNLTIITKFRLFWSITTLLINDGNKSAFDDVVDLLIFPVRKLMKTRSSTTHSSPNINVKTESKILKSTNNIATSASSNDVANSDTDQSNPQVSYRVVISINPIVTTLLQTTTSSTGNNGPQILVMMPNNNTNNDNNQNTPKNVADQKRRMTHREIERRRRDKINDWIYALSKEVPDCATDRTKQGQSKGGILAKRSDVERLKRRITDIEEDRIHYKDEAI